MSAPLCLHCKKSPATPDPKPDMKRVFWRALHEGETEEQRKALDRRRPRRFCDACRKAMAGAAISDDEALAMFEAVILRIDPVKLLLDAVDAENKRLKRNGLLLPNITLRAVRAMKRATTPQEPRRPGETAAAFRQRRYRARKTQPKA